MTYKRTLSYATQARIKCAERKGHEARAAEQPRTANQYKTKWDRDNWDTGWFDADIEQLRLAEPPDHEGVDDDGLPF